MDAGAEERVAKNNERAAAAEAEAAAVQTPWWRMGTSFFGEVDDSNLSTSPKPPKPSKLKHRSASSPPGALQAKSRRAPEVGRRVPRTHRALILTASVVVPLSHNDNHSLNNFFPVRCLWTGHGFGKNGAER